MKSLCILTLLLACQSTTFEAVNTERDSASHLIAFVKLVPNNQIIKSKKIATLSYLKRKITYPFFYNEATQSYRVEFPNLNRHYYDSVEFKFIDEKGVLIVYAMKTDIYINEYGDIFLELKNIKYL